MRCPHCGEDSYDRSSHVEQVEIERIIVGSHGETLLGLHQIRVFCRVSGIRNWRRQTGGCCLSELILSSLENYEFDRHEAHVRAADHEFCVQAFEILRAMPLRLRILSVAMPS